MTEHRFYRASRYIEGLRSPLKRRYAHAYYQWLRMPDSLRPAESPSRGELSYMAAQAVRMNLDEILEDNPHDPLCP